MLLVITGSGCFIQFLSDMKRLIEAEQLRLGSDDPAAGVTRGARLPVSWACSGSTWVPGYRADALHLQDFNGLRVDLDETHQLISAGS